MDSAEQIAKPAADAGVAELEATLARVKAAQQKYATYSQEQVDAIFKAAALAANRAKIFSPASLSYSSCGFRLQRSK